MPKFTCNVFTWLLYQACAKIELVVKTNWLKRRTSRGRANGTSRPIKRPARFSFSNIDHDLRKNQLFYSYNLLKIVAIFILGLIWWRLDFAMGSIDVIPVGCLVGILIIYAGAIRQVKFLQLSVLFVAVMLSYFLPVGIVI